MAALSVVTMVDLMVELKVVMRVELLGYWLAVHWAASTVEMRVDQSVVWMVG